MSPRPLFFATQNDFRAWLAEHHDTASELLVGFHKKGTGRPSMTWPESVDQALCYGWIDGVRRSLGASSYTIRFTPRKKGSIWSAVNVKRAQELNRLGLMSPGGLKTFNSRDPEKTNRYSFEQQRAKLGAGFEKQFRANRKAWEYFQSRPPGYRKVATWWVISAKKEETRLKRLATLIADSAARRVIGPLRWATSVRGTGPSRSRAPSRPSSGSGSRRA